MQFTAFICFGLITTFGAPGFAAEILPVPNPSAKGAIFSAVVTGVYRAEGDGATALVDNVALVRGLNGTCISVTTSSSEKPVSLRLMSGSAEIYVADAPLNLQVGEVVIALKRAEISIIQDAGHRYLLVHRVRKGGKAVLVDSGQGDVAAHVSRFTSGAIVPNTPRFIPGLAPIGIPLLRNRIQALVENRVLPTDETARRRFDSVKRRFEVKPTEIELTPIDVDGPSDLAVIVDSDEDAPAAVEIEEIEIEIEAGCVEVCHD
jgi:hypothetical protein